MKHPSLVSPRTADPHERPVHVVTRARLRAPLDLSWDTLLDHPRLADFVDDLHTSDTLWRSGSRALCRADGHAGFDPFKMQFSLTVTAHELLLQSLTAHGPNGGFARFDSGYRLRAEADGATHLEHFVRVQPQSNPPPPAGETLLRRAVLRNFEALTTEIERRAAQQHGGPDARRPQPATHV